MLGTYDIHNILVTTWLYGLYEKLLLLDVLGLEIYLIKVYLFRVFNVGEGGITHLAIFC